MLLNKKVVPFHQYCFGMNTRLDVVFWGQPSTISHHSAFTTINERLMYWEKILSKYDSLSETYEFNRLKENETLTLSIDLWSVMTKCVAYRKLTHGYFDVFYESEVDGDTLSDWLVWNENTREVTKLCEGVKVDFGGIGKGWFLQEVNQILDDNHIENALVSFGDSSIMTKGRHPHGDHWPFACQESTGIDTTFELNHHTLSISGLNQGQRHIVVPEDGQLSETSHTVVVQNNNAIEAEVLSTALIAAPKELHHQIVKNFEVEQIVFSNSKA